MRITDMKMDLSKEEGTTKAVFSVVLDEELEISGICLLETEDQDYLIQYPYLTDKYGSVVEICYPISKTLLEDIYRMAVNRYILEREQYHLGS